MKIIMVFVFILISLLLHARGLPQREGLGPPQPDVKTGSQQDDSRQELTVRIPNAFMPVSNIQGNQRFRAFFSNPPFNYSLKVYNQWGSLIFSSEDHMESWDGTYENADAPAGAYVYQISYSDYAGRQQRHNGLVMLIR